MDASARRHAGRGLAAVIFVSMSSASIFAQTFATELSPETVADFDKYVLEVEARLQERIDGSRPFLWSDEDAGRRRRLADGEVVAETFGRNPVEVRRGLIHGWIGAVFIPGTSLESVREFLQDFDRHEAVYPEVIDSKSLGAGSREGSVRGYLKLKREKVLTAVLATEHEAVFTERDATHWHSQSKSTRIVEVVDFGTPDERELPEGKDSGFLWRMNSYWLLEQLDGGVVAELLSVSLSRAPPTGTGWMVRPFITSIPEESLRAMLEVTRDVLQK